MRKMLNVNGEAQAFDTIEGLAKVLGRTTQSVRRPRRMQVTSLMTPAYCRSASVKAPRVPSPDPGSRASAAAKNGSIVVALEHPDDIEDETSAVCPLTAALAPGALLLMTRPWHGTDGRSS